MHKQLKTPQPLESRHSMLEVSLGGSEIFVKCCVSPGNNVLWLLCFLRLCWTEELPIAPAVPPAASAGWPVSL